MSELRGIPVPEPEQAATWIMLLPERFARKFRVYDNGCWLWAAGTSTGGYGRFWWNGKTRNAHRVSYELCVGPIPAELHLDHLCRDHACVNPAHLEPVSCRVNLLRGETFQAANAAKTHCLRGHPLDGENVYVSRGRRHCCSCRREQKRKAAS